MDADFLCFRQATETECGIVCLATVLLTLQQNSEYSPTVEKLRQLIPTDEEGASCLALVAAARQCGLPAQGYQTDLAGLRQLPLPCIAHWRGQTVNHFVVVHQLGETDLLLADPAQGLRHETLPNFAARWSGVVIVFESPLQFTW